MNQTILLALLSRCRQVILESGTEDQQFNDTLSAMTTPTSAQTTASTRDSYDNAYFYILFVMFFYSFLALALFRSFLHNDKTKKEPYEEFMGEDPSAPKFNPGSSVEKFYFEEENSL